jgi:hypothetical protein
MRQANVRVVKRTGGYFVCAWDRDLANKIIFLHNNKERMDPVSILAWALVGVLSGGIMAVKLIRTKGRLCTKKEVQEIAENATTAAVGIVEKSIDKVVDESLEKAKKDVEVAEKALEKILNKAVKVDDVSVAKVV